MNLIRGIFALIVSVFLGVHISNKYKEKTNFYVSFKNFNTLLKNEVSFSKNTRLDVVDKLIENNEFNIVIKNYFNKNELILNKGYLTIEEKEFFKNYLENVGAGDADSQLKYFDIIHNAIEEKRVQALADEKKFKPLCIKLSVLIGLILFIILI